MALIYSQGVLEAEEVVNNVVEVARQLNEAANNGVLFVALEAPRGDSVVLQIPLIVKIKDSDD